jgi:hypothetical protein
MIKRVYHIPGHMLNHIFHDNNCTLARMVCDDLLFKNVDLSVDVFHFKTKHSTNNHFCQENRNPVAFPELLGENGGWYFNSLIAKQTNVWFGGYHAICHEMLVDKYIFFLDEMIMCKNCGTVLKLKKDGQDPDYYPFSQYIMTR